LVFNALVLACLSFPGLVFLVVGCLDWAKLERRRKEAMASFIVVVSFFMMMIRLFLLGIEIL
jgi:uncharacterized membrane protein